MALKKYLFLIVVSSLQITNLAQNCPEVCECNKNLSWCQTCSYNLTIKDNAIVYHQVLVCCSEKITLESWVKNYVNKTAVDVSLHYINTCNSSNFDIVMSMLDINSLSLRNNNIVQIKLSVKVQNLRHIDLSSNKLPYITKGLFNSFSNLRSLILSRNEIFDIFEESFDGLSKLESLDLSENNLSILTNVFTPLKNLQHLNLSRNNIEFIHENYFNNWLLQHLDVSHNNLRKLAPGALQLLPNLARLLLTDNPHLGITQLDTQLLVGTGRRLQQIDASRIGLYQVPEAFTHSVRFLSLVGNRISSVRCGDLDSYPLLQSLDFSDNKITSVEDDSLGRLEMLLFLNLNNNLLITIPKSLPDELKYLSINNNFVQNLTISDFKSLPNLRILLLQKNKIQYIQDHVFDDLLSLEMLDLSSNPIRTLSPNTFDGPLSLQDLRLCYLNISVPAQDGSFPMSSPESVQMLHLQSSPGLARQFLADSAALAAFSHLQYLDLRMNNLSEIRNDLIFYLVQLKTLRLHGNSINCSAELWLKDWMNWNKSLVETCYYSSSEAKPEIARYNCTFPETFTISESLPPVNLYSTEMINKLLRYYGYLNKKSDKNAKYGMKRIKNTIQQVQINPTSIQVKNYENHVINTESNTFPSRSSNQILVNDYKELFKNSDQNKFQNDQLDIENKILDIESFSTRIYKTNNIDVTNTIIGTGKRLNTAIKSVQTTYYDIKNNGSDENTSTLYKENRTVNVANTAIIQSKSEYSPYQSADISYASYVGTGVVSTMITMSLILWISFRLKYRKRHTSVPDTESENQIEVSNISGRVLW